MDAARVGSVFETRHIDAVMEIVFDGVRKDGRQVPETEIENADGSI